MDFSFGKTEMQTLNDLQALAKKHGMVIGFGCSSFLSRDVNEELLEHKNIDPKIIKMIMEEENLTVANAISTLEDIWFRLYDEKNNKSHTMSYRVKRCDFTIENIDWEDLSNSEREALRNLIETDYGNYFDFDYCPTVIRGFGYADEVTDFRVYRSGMALKFFGDLVCDFLGEPRINRVY